MSKAQVSLGIINKNKYASIEEYILNEKELFDKLYSLKKQNRRKTDWQRLSDMIVSRIIYHVSSLI